MITDVKSVENEAYRFLSEDDHLEASKLFSKAGTSYQECGDHQQAAFCFASAASCWAQKAGEKALFYYAATCYEKAAKEAEISGAYEYASILYKHAGICYERDLEYVGFAECFYLSNECYRKYLSRRLFDFKRISGLHGKRQKYSFKEYLRLIVPWSSLTFSSFIWGHGERPQRTIVFGGFLVLLAALFYVQGYIIENGVTAKPRFFEALYLSLVTFIRFSPGDVVFIGFNNSIAIIESCLSGIIIVPLFITGLCRKYLRFV